MAGRAIAALALLVVASESGNAQDTVTSARHALPLDTLRIAQFHRVYDMVMHTRDSTVVIGQRDVVLEAATYGGNPAWRLVESRSGVVPAAETLYVTTGMRPLQWFVAQRESRIGATFVGDTVFGAISTPGGRLSMIVRSQPDLLVSQAMIESVMALLPLTAQWTDSTGVLAVDMAGGTVIPSELSVIGEEDVVTDSTRTRPAWVVALRAEMRTVLLWIDKENGETHRVQQPVPPHVGTLLEYRRRYALALPPG